MEVTRSGREGREGREGNWGLSPVRGHGSWMKTLHQDRKDSHSLSLLCFAVRLGVSSRGGVGGLVSMSHLTPPVQPCGLGLTGLHRLHTLLPETQAGAVTAPTINIPFQKQSRDRLHFHSNSSPLTLTPTLEIKQLPVKPSRKLKIRKKSLSSIFDLFSLIKQKRTKPYKPD